MANAPRDDLTMDFHVRMLDGGVLSTVLARGLATGARQVTPAVPIRAAECHGEECPACFATCCSMLTPSKYGARSGSASTLR